MGKELEVLECLEWISSELKIYYEHLYIVLRDSKEELISKKKKANEYLDTIKQALINYKNITKQIEEADYKSAIVLLVKIKDNLDSYTYNTILEALLKAQEQEQYYFDLIQLLKENNMDYYTLKEMFKQQEPKKYLKWEDLEFGKEEQTMKVLLNGERYLVKYVNEWFCGWCNKVQITNGTYILCTLGNGMKQFFNDLHLERVEE